MSANTTMNGTHPFSCFSNTTAEKMGKTFSFALVLVISLAGNSLIGTIVYKTKTMRKPINFLIVNMAMSDLLFPVFTFPNVRTRIKSGLLGQALCKLAFFLPSVSLAVSIQSLVLIAVDRLGAVVFPLRSPLIGSKLFILGTWIVAMATFSPYLSASKLVDYPGGVVCDIQWNEVFGKSSSPADFNLAINVVFIFTPLVLIATIYITIFLKLKSQKIPGELPSNVAQRRVKRERNVLKMAIAIVLGFAVCWLPFSINWFIHVYGSGIFSCDLTYFAFVADFIARANCAINPCICFIFSTKFRRGLKKLFRCF